MEISLKKMKNFKDLIDQEQKAVIDMSCPSHFDRPDLNDVSTDCPICRTYNNLWGMLTDTHMSHCNDMYIITGSYFENLHAASNLIYSSTYGGTQLGNTMSFPYPCFASFMYNNGYEGKDAVWNGSKAFIFNRIIMRKLGSEIATVISGFNKYPRQIDLSELKESDNIVAAINESKNIAGKNWIYAELEGCKYLISCNENDTIKINLGNIVTESKKPLVTRYTVRINEYKRNNYAKRLIVEDTLFGHQYYGYVTAEGVIENENSKELKQLNETLTHIEKFNAAELENGFYEAVGKSMYDDKCEYKLTKR